MLEVISTIEASSRGKHMKCTSSAQSVLLVIDKYGSFFCSVARVLKVGSSARSELLASVILAAFSLTTLGLIFYTL